MSELGSEVDIVACDKEMEEMGKCMSGRVREEVQEENRKFQSKGQEKCASDNSVSFSCVFREVHKNKIEGAEEERAYVCANGSYSGGAGEAGSGRSLSSGSVYRGHVSDADASDEYVCDQYDGYAYDEYEYEYEWDEETSDADASEEYVCECAVSDEYMCGNCSGCVDEVYETETDMSETEGVEVESEVSGKYETEESVEVEVEYNTKTEDNRDTRDEMDSAADTQTHTRDTTSTQTCTSAHTLHSAHHTDTTSIMSTANANNIQKMSTENGSPLKQKSINTIKSHWSKAEAMEKACTYSTGIVNMSKYVQETETLYSEYLPTLGIGPSDGILRVSSETVIELIERQQKYVLLDCRYKYEYDGGHVVSAENTATQKDVSLVFERITKNEQKNIVVIFYCEYSSVRAPKLATYLRNEDRRTSTYPMLRIPNVYVMHSGYREFYKKHKKYCTPCGYVPM